MRWPGSRFARVLLGAASVTALLSPATFGPAPAATAGPALIALTAPIATAPMGQSPTAASQPKTGRTKTGRTKADRARADTAKAEAAASRARARVDALLDRYQSASTQVDVGVRALSQAFAAGTAAEVDDDAAAARQRRALAAQATQVRAVYAAGGPAGLTGSVLGASSPDDVLWRVSTADRVLATLLATTRNQVVSGAERAALTRRRARAADAATDAQARALDGLQNDAAIAATALTQAQQTLGRLDTRARQAKAAQESLRQIAAARAAARAARLRAMGQVTALGIPAEYQQAYEAAARTCPGMAWTLLAGVGQVESGHGRNNGPSSAGAIGPMQFMPSTFAAYAVDGDHNGVLDAWDPQDAIFTAAHYLCRTGATSAATAGSAVWKHTALLAYNHAEWYVDLVLAAEQAISARAAAPLP